MPDAVLVPGGGVREDGELPPWVIARLDKAIEIANGAPIVTLSAGTPHKPKMPVFESVAGARYLQACGYPKESILTETASYDTIGNAFFARTIHTDPAGFRRLAVITSDFHMPRTKAIFRWIFGAAPAAPAYELEFAATPSEPFAARVEKEKRSLDALRPRFGELTTLKDIHRWLYSEHELYATGLSRQPVDDPAILQSY